MIKIDTLEIQKNIEEKRQIYGKKLENFLLLKSRSFLSKVDEFLGSKNFCLWSVSIIFLLSIFLRSRVDIGYDSGFYIEIAAKIAQGGRYYYDFFESNFPLSFFIHLIPYYISQFIGFSQIIIADYFINFLGIVSIVSSSYILKKSDLSKTHQNLIISSFALGFFLRVETLAYNEFLTKTSFYLALAFPYIAYSFARKIPLNNKDKIWRGILAGLIPCLKPHYIILPIIIEVSRFWQNKSTKFFLELDKLIMLLVGCAYLVFMIKFTPEFFEYMVPMWSSVYQAYESDNFIYYLSYNIFAKIIILGIFLAFLKQKFSSQDKILFLVGLASGIILLLEGLISEDRGACFFGIATAVFVKFFYDFIKSQKNNLTTNDVFLLAGLLVLSFLDEDIETMRSLIFFWVIIIPIASFCLYKKLQKDFPEFRKKYSITSLLIASSTFIAVALVGIVLAEQKSRIFNLMSVLIFFLFLFLYEKYYQKYYQKFSSFFIFVQSSLAASLLSFYIFTISDSYQGNVFYKSPNFFSESLIEYSKAHLKEKDEQVLIFSYHIFDRMPMANFLGNGKSDETIRTMFLFDKISQKKSEEANFTINYMMNNLKNRMSDKNTKILFINNLTYLMRKDRCIIEFLEYYFQDLEFRKIFLENYEYAGRIFAATDLKEIPQIEFLSKEKDSFDNIKLSKQEPLYDFEIYTRRF